MLHRSFVSMLLVVGCSASRLALPDSGAQADAGAPLDVETFVDRYSRSSCERIVRCAAPPDVNAWWDVSGVECERIFPAQRAVLERALANGTVRFDPDAASACLAAIASSCTFGWGQHPSCDRALIGTQAIGGSCGSDFECAPGLHCEGIDPCVGTCARDAQLGDSCAMGERCAAGLACDYDGSGRCETATHESRAEGEPCGTISSPADGVVVAVCGPELYCSETCRAFPPEGAICDPDGPHPQCAAGTLCAVASDGTFRCTRPTVRTEEGASCEEPLVLCDRFRRLICEAGECVRIGGSGSARCAARFGQFDCEPGLACIEERCRPSGPDPCAR